MAKKEKTRKVIETLLSLSGFGATGIANSITGPALQDLQELTHSTTDSISAIFLVMAVVGLAAGILATFLVGKLNYWMLMAVAMGVLGAVQICIPFCTNLVALGIVQSIVTIFIYIYGTCGNTYIIKSWGDDHKPWLQALHFIFGIGSWIGPLIVTPFISNSNREFETNNSTETKQNETQFEHYSGTQIKYAYFIAAAIFLLHCMIYIILFLMGDRSFWSKPEDTNTEKAETTEIVPDYKNIFLIMFIVCMFIFYWMYIMLEMMYDIYLTTYTVEELHWTKRSGATLTSVFWGAFTLGRGAGIFVIQYVRPAVLLIAMSILTVISITLEIIFAHYNDSVMWICSVTFGFGLSTMYANGWSFADTYIDMSGGLGGVFIGAGSLGVLGPALMIPLYRKYGIETFMYEVFVGSIIMTVVILGALAMGERHIQGKEIQKNTEESEKTPIISKE